MAAVYGSVWLVLGGLTHHTYTRTNHGTHSGWVVASLACMGEWVATPDPTLSIISLSGTVVSP